MSATKPPRLEVRGLGKRFGSFVALDDVSLDVAPGTVHALLGENGAGKSTLVKSIMGYHRADEGHVRLGEREIVPKSPREAQELGIGMVYQHFTLVPNMTVAENLVLSRPRLPFFLDWPKEHRDLAAFMSETPFQVDLASPVRSLAAGEKQKLEILKQLYLKSSIIILDEPTSVLTPAEADEVLGLLHEMAQRGQVSLIIITHKFREVTAFADEVTVLRRGRRVGGGTVKDLTPAAMAEMMMGAAAPQSVRPARSNAPARAEIRLETQKLSANDDFGLPALSEVSIGVRSGEIVGIAAVAGNGQEELVEVLAGQRQKASGRVVVRGIDYRATRKESRLHKVRCLPEDPLRNACVPPMSVAENMSFRKFDEPPFALASLAISPRAMARSAEKLIADYRVKTPSSLTPIASLSGGNVQRAVLARELDGDVQVLIAANPCMGLDFAAVAEIHDRIRKARDAGTAILLVSADLDEIFALADRVLVMSEGKVVHETTPAAADLRVIGQCMAGQAEHG
ncbi:MAG TPA: ABC transporter ATP-binding protein [Polyangiaceae bacterium]|nr:ABC transporter ATP-binding protein [Polyangiaceae bacterium]